MKHLFIAAAFSALVHIGQAAIPTCAVACLESAVASSTICSRTDILCKCANTSEIELATGSCVVTCGEEEAFGKISVTLF
jgi:hypothetical protein